MELTDTYQQDTIKSEILLKIPDSIGKKELKVHRSDVILQPIRERDTNVVQTVQESAKTEIPKISAAARSRYRWWQQEQEMVVGDSRYMSPNKEVRITSTEKAADNGIILPTQKINSESADWLTILLIGILVLFATVRTNYSKYLTQLFQSVFNYSASVRLFQEKNFSLAHGAFRLEVYFYLTISVFLFQIFTYFSVKLPYSNIGLFLFALGLVMFYFLGKKFIYRLMGFVVEQSEETSEYLFNMDNVNRVTGLILFPIVLLIAFYPGQDALIPVLAGIVVVLFLYSALIYRGIKILLRKQFSIYYLFLYFCTLEFLPLVLLYKIVVL